MGIVQVFSCDWNDCRGPSKNKVFSWDVCSDENKKPGTILSLNVVCTGSPVVIML